MKISHNDWHVLRVKYHHEKKIHTLLKEYSIDSFLPLATTIRQWSDRRKKIEKPLFPNYLFVRISSRKDISRVLAIQGVFQFICWDGQYAKLKEEEIRIIRQLTSLDGIENISVSKCFPKIGDEMTIIHGPLRGLNCIITKSNGNNTIFVKIMGINQNITAKVPSIYLDKPMIPRSS